MPDKDITQMIRKDITERLRDRDNHDCSEAADEIERLRKERDEARREWCIQSIEAQKENRAPVRILAKKLAEDIRGWDCFKEEP